MAGRFSQRRYRAEHCRWQCLAAAEPGPALTNATGLRMVSPTFFPAATLQTPTRRSVRPCISRIAGVVIFGERLGMLEPRPPKNRAVNVHLNIYPSRACYPHASVGYPKSYWLG
jgi:hypothetical protein